MSVKIGSHEFDHVEYDEDADVLYLSIGEPREAEGAETREGHFVRYDENGEVCGVTIIDAQYLLERDGRICVTVPEREPVDIPGGDLLFA